MMRRQFRGLLLVVLLAVVTAACGDDGGSNADTASATAQAVGTTTSGASVASTTTSGPRSITHAKGTTVVPANPQRIVSASVSITGFLLALDAPVVASGATRASTLTDSQGFFLQWAPVAGERKVAVLAGPIVGAEAVAAQRPDLIVGTAAGGDAVATTYDQLSKIAPTIVYDTTAASWQDITKQLGMALGRETQAAKVTKDHEAKIATAKARISRPTSAAVALVLNADAASVYTAGSPIGQMLGGLGFTVTSPSGGTQIEGGNRSDVMSISFENLPAMIEPATVFLVYGDAATADKFKATPVLANTSAVKNGRVHPLGFESFRLDPYSANLVIDRIDKALTK